MARPTPASVSTEASGGAELDVRLVLKPQRHPLIFSRFDTLAVGQSFVLINDHDPKHLREEFERDHPGAYDWIYLPTDDRQLFRIRITRLSATGLPRIVGTTGQLFATSGASSDGTGDGVFGVADAGGAVWRLEPRERQLDANVIRIGAGDSIQAHDGPDLDVLLHVLSGSGQIDTVLGTVDLAAGALVWLPRRSRRAILAGPDGLAYLSVHPRRPALSVGPAMSPDESGAGPASDAGHIGLAGGRECR